MGDILDLYGIIIERGRSDKQDMYGKRRVGENSPVEYYVPGH